MNQGNTVLGQISESKFLLLQLSYAQSVGRMGIQKKIKTKAPGTKIKNVQVPVLMHVNPITFTNKLQVC